MADKTEEARDYTSNPSFIIPAEEVREWGVSSFCPSPSSYEIMDLVRSKQGLIWIVCEDEQRVCDNIYWLSQKLGRRPFYWSCASGLWEWSDDEDAQVTLKEKDAPPDEKGDPIMQPHDVLAFIEAFNHHDDINGILERQYSENNVTGSIFVLKDFHRFLEDPTLLRQLKDLSHLALWHTDQEAHRRKAVIVTAPTNEIPVELRDITTVVDFRYPTENEVRNFFDGAQQEGVVEAMSDKDMRELVESAKGMSITRLVSAARLCATRSDGKLHPEMMMAEKEQIVKKSHVLEMMPSDIPLEEIGGMDKVKEHFRRMSFAIHHPDDARARGITITNDILLVGIPGCGKSYSAMAAGNYLGVPSIRLDMGRVYQSYVGQSETNIRIALKTIEGLAPCVLLIDEVEKGMAGSQSSGQTDGGTSARVFGFFLTWLQEKPDGIAVIATANDITQLPPEFLRKGRFDEIYYVGLPTVEERRDIFGIHLVKTAHRKSEDFDLDALAEDTTNFSGAEIEAIIQRANQISFVEGRELSTQDILNLRPGWKILFDSEREKLVDLEQKAAVRWEWCSTLQEQSYGATGGVVDKPRGKTSSPSGMARPGGSGGKFGSI